MANSNISHHFTNNFNTKNGEIYSKKRTLDQIHEFENTPYFKIRSIVSQLGPLIQKAALSTDIDTCESRPAIQEKLALLVEQCRQQSALLINCNGSKKQAEQKPLLQPRPDHSTQEKRFPAGNGIVKQTHESHVIPGSYIVGGSAFGWNFLMFNGTKPEYYGRTKEAFRAGKRSC
ncbi:hypothetical protein vseg_019013 [Gypsophila vaccaria]